MTDSVTLLTAVDLAFVLPQGEVLFDDLAFGLGRERTGMVGPNGSGKTSLARILAGELHPTRGYVVRNGRIAYLPQRRTPLPKTLTVADALGVAERLRALRRIESGGDDEADYERVGTAWDLEERTRAELGRLGLQGLGLDRVVGSLSGGETTRVLLAGLVFEEPELAILDEPTNDLDAQSREALYRWVEGWKGGLLVISHDRALLGRMDRILELSGMGLQVYGGDYTAYAEQKRMEDEAAARDLAHARTALRRTERDAQTARERQERRSGRGHRDRLGGGVPRSVLGARKDNAEATTGRLANVGDKRVADARRLVGVARERLEERERLGVKLTSTGLHASRRVLELRGVRYTYPGAPAPVLGGVTLVVRGPERMVVSGPNGAGKTTLLRLIMGELEPQSGTVTLGVGPGDVAYLDQRAELLRPGARVLDCFREVNPDLDLTASRYALARYLFAGDAALAKVDSLSGGERIRAALACTVGASRPPWLLLLDEPTNHLDLDSIHAVEDVLRAYDGALIVVSHDRAFLEAVGVERTISL
ncbi:MAG: ABC-F family ATP-binding cassette domain-containing protein [Gemmatimonadota bacterium]